jgi:ACS family hexuronate transporter-like MFS transporter
MFDSNSVATVMGLCGTVGAIGGILVNLIIGLVSERFSFLPIWIASGTMYPLALLILFFIVGHIRRIELNYK